MADPPRGVIGDLWADKILGQFDFSQMHDNEVNAKSVFFASSVFVDSSHDSLYWWDAGNNRVLVVRNLKNAVTGQGADLVLGQNDFVHSGCNHDSNWQSFNWRTFPNGFYSPPVLPSATCLCGQGYMVQSPGEGGSVANMASDAQGNLYVPDAFNNRVLEFNYPIYTGESASAVWGQLDGTGQSRFDFHAFDNDGTDTPGGPSNQNLGFFQDPHATDGNGNPEMGVAIDAWGNLWVADSLNNRVLRFPNPNAPGAGVPSSTADVVLGQADFISNSPNSNVNNLTTFPVLNNPSVLRVDVSGNVYVGESNGNYGRITIFRPTGVTGLGVPIYGHGYASYKNVVDATSQPRGMEIDPNLNSATQVGLWVIDHGAGNYTHAFYYKVTWPTFSMATLKDFPIPEALYSPGVASNGDLYLADYRGMSISHYPVGTSSPDGLQIFLPPAGFAGTANLIGDAGFHNDSETNVVVASAPGSGITQIIAADAIRLHFWNVPAAGLGGLSNGQVEDGYAGASQPYAASSALGYGQMTVDPTGHYVWAVDGDSNSRVIDAFSLPLSANPEINPVATVNSPLPVLGKSVLVSWTNLTGLAADESGNLWISDLLGGRVMRVRDPMGKAGGPIVDVILGQPDPGSGPVGVNCNGTGTLTGSTCSSDTPSASTFNFPSWLQFDHHGDFYVSDHWLEFNGNFRMLRFDAKSLPTGNSACVFAIPADGVYGTGGSMTSLGSTLYDNSFWEMAFNSDDSVMVAGTNSQISGGYPPVIIQSPRNGINPVGTADIPGAGDNPIGHLNDYGPQTYGVAFDSQDNLYAFDGNRSRVLIYYQPFPRPTPTFTPANTPTGTLTPSPTFTITGTPTPGCGGCASPKVTYGTGVQGSGPGQLYGNSQLAVGSTSGTEYVYFADIVNNRIDQFNAATGAFVASFNGVDAVKNPGGLSSPYGVALSGDGRYLFAAATNGNEVVKMDLNNSGAVSAVMTVFHPVYLTIDTAGNGDIYSGTDDSVVRIHEQTPNNYVTVGILGTPGTRGSATNLFNGSFGVLVQDDGNKVFVADRSNNRIVEWTTEDGGATYDYAATVFSNGIVPFQMAADPALPNRIYVGTTNEGYVILDGSTTPMWSQVYQCFPESQNPVGIGVDGSSVYFSLPISKGDSFTKPFDYCLTPVVTATPTSSGPTDTPTASPTPISLLSCGSGTPWAVSQPSGIALDSAGNIYAVDNSTNLIDVFYPNGTLYTHIGGGHLTAPSAVAVDGNGVIYVTDEISSLYTVGSTQFRIEVFNGLSSSDPGSFLTSWGTSASSTGLLEVPEGIAVNSAGTTVYVADQNTNQIEIFNGTGTLLTHWGTPGDGGNGTFGYPVGLALDSTGNVYVADWETNLVQVFNPGGTWLRQWDVTKGTGLLAAQFIAVYRGCVVYVTDGFGEVGVFDTDGNVLGTVVQGGEDEFIDTEGVAVDGSGNWYVADLANEEITGFNACPVTLCPEVDPTVTPTWTMTPSATPTWTPSISVTPTITLTNTPTPSSTNTPSVTSTLIPTATGTPTFSPTSTDTFTVTPTVSREGILIGPPYPNPVGKSPVVSFAVQAPGLSKVTWDVFTVAFREIASGTQKIPGSGVVTWDLRDNWGNPVADGLYYIRVRVDSGSSEAVKILKVIVSR